MQFIGITTPSGTHPEIPDDVIAARLLTTQQLKDLWDIYDGNDMHPISGEAVHRVLNERGEGEYCAV